ncbi:MAG: hypothetical protein OIF50_14370 [Flavobacteriaceae bacterium]|nr:hypothetical protein [Flavobacteriaceae bacterium]
MVLETEKDEKFYQPLDPYYLRIRWDRPSVNDGSSFYHNIYIDGQLHASQIEASQNRYTFTQLEEDKTYKMEIETVAANDTKRKASLSFRTYKYPILSFLKTKVTEITTTRAMLQWDAVYIDAKPRNTISRNKKTTRL